jgi:polysaccharide chain length determinant protein (PEP-CTERM system associated)
MGLIENMDDFTISLQDLKAMLLRRRWGLLLPMCAIFWLAMAMAFLLPSIYRSMATILIEEQEIPANFVQTTVTGFAEQRLQNIYQRIVSTSRLLEIIKELRLYPQLQNEVNPDEIAAKMRKDISLDFVKADIIDPKSGRPASANIAFTLSYTGKNPAQTQKVTSVLTSLFLEENLKERAKKADSATNFLQEEANRVKEAMAESDAKIADFKEKHPNELPEFLPINMQSLQSIEINSVRYVEQLKTLRERESYQQSQLATIPRQGLQKNRLEELRVQLANRKSRYSDKYPDVIAVKSEIEKITAEKGGGQGGTADNPAQAALAAQLASTKSEITSVGRQITTNEQQAEKYRKLIEATPRVEEGYRVMLNERDNQLRKYNELMQKHMEAQVSQGLEKGQQGERFTVVEPALLPEKPIKPNRLAIAFIGIVLGIGAGVGSVALLEFNDQSIRSAERLAQATSFPVLGVIPEIFSAAERRRARRKNLMELVALIVQMVLAVAALAALRSVG